jgi:hypothetical protein
VDFDWKVLATATKATIISAAMSVGANIYCRVPAIAIQVPKYAAKPDCFLPVGYNGSSIGLCSTSKLIVKMNEAQL